MDVLQRRLGGLKIEDFKNDEDITNANGIILQEYQVTLNQGSTFGEKGLDENKPRNASIIAKDDCDLGLIKKEGYLSVLRELSVQISEKLKNFIRFNVFQHAISSVVAENIYYDFFRLKFFSKKGDFIYSQNSPSSCIYLVYKGKVRISHRQRIQSKKFKHELLASKVEYKNVPVCDLGVGEIFGETWLVSNCKSRMFNARSIEDSIILKVKSIDLSEHFRTQMGFMHTLL